RIISHPRSGGRVGACRSLVLRFNARALAHFPGFCCIPALRIGASLGVSGLFSNSTHIVRRRHVSSLPILMLCTLEQRILEGMERCTPGGSLTSLLALSIQEVVYGTKLTSSLLGLGRFKALIEPLSSSTLVARSLLLGQP